MEVTLDDAYRGATKELEIPRLDTCPEWKGSGGAAGSGRKPCRECGGHGQVRRVQRSGFAQFIQIAPCPRCGGTGSVIEKPCRLCKGNGVQQARKKLQVHVPAGAANGQTLRLRGEGNMVEHGLVDTVYTTIHPKPQSLIK